jgi:uncharacterized membrane-anchored protein
MEDCMRTARLYPAVICAVVFLFFALLAPVVAHAEDAPAPAPPPSAATRQAELQAAWEAAGNAGTKGPAKIPLIDQAVLNVSGDYVFVPKAEGMRLMRALGNTIDDRTFVGLVLGATSKIRWIVVARYIKEGYIKDDDAKNWNADELLQSLKEGTEESNKDRAARGFPEMEILGWVEKPAYDSTTHRLVWSARLNPKGQPSNGTTGINYNTYALGRDGYFSLNLLTSSDHIGNDKGIAQELLADLAYNKGKNYEDFNVSTDHIAAYGLAALVGGLAAKKLGLLAVIGVFVAKFAKVIALAVFGFGAAVMKLFRRNAKNARPDGPA